MIQHSLNNTIEMDTKAKLYKLHKWVSYISGPFVVAIYGVETEAVVDALIAGDSRTNVGHTGGREGGREGGEGGEGGREGGRQKMRGQPCVL